MKAITTLIHADSFFSRACGLLFRTKLKSNELFWLRRCKAVHTVGMQYPIAVYFLDQDHKVIRVIRDLKPFRLAWIQQAVSVVETLASAELTAEDIELAIQLFLDRR